MSAIPADITATSVPLNLTVSGTLGGITGLAPTVAVRNGATLDSYLDWDDDTFKTSGWVTKNALMSEVGGGHYQRSLSMVDIGAASGSYYVAEYNVDDGGSVKGADEDVIAVTSLVSDLTLLRRLAFNRLEETPGNPGSLILYADDATTPLKTWSTRDYTGGATVGELGAPARRSAAT